jgi:hypothetical protein
MRNLQTPEGQKEVERIWELRREAIILLGHVAAEWETDPLSVQCFDLRLVKRTKEVLAELKKLDVFNDV